MFAVSGDFFVSRFCTKPLNPERAFEFGSIFHKAIYVDGLHSENINGYGKYAEKIGFNSADFVELMSDKTYQESAQDDFDFSNKYGITEFAILGLIAK